MKLVNFASLDPAIIKTGRTGLSNASALDREIWEEFNADWEKLTMECQYLYNSLISEQEIPIEQPSEYDTHEINDPDFTGETKQVIAEYRIKQRFFRRAVLSNYRSCCCISGLSEPKLLIASHIVPWSKDPNNRLNPSNGLCLSALHDKAFDSGLITLTDDMTVLVSKNLLHRKDDFIKQTLISLAGQNIRLPDKFIPKIEFIRRHRQEIFIDHRNNFCQRSP